MDIINIPYAKIREESKLFKLATLLSVYDLISKENFNELVGSLSPDRLVFDIHSVVRGRQLKEETANENAGLVSDEVLSNNREEASANTDMLNEIKSDADANAKANIDAISNVTAGINEKTAATTDTNEEPLSTVMEETDVITMYKALIGYTLQNKYSYGDYIKGGLSLLKKDKFLNKIYATDELTDILDILKEEYEACDYELRNKCISVKRSSKIISIVVMIMLAIACTVLAGLTIYNYVYKLRIDRAYIDTYEAYLDKEYVKAIDVASVIKLEEMDMKLKQILATSYAKTENLTDEQIGNIVSDINALSAEQVVDYWISLGRGDAVLAESYAKQLSDDELLLYAYMREKQILTENTEIDGEEKAARLNELETAVDNLKKNYEVDKEDE